jgi:hypothetical protein
MRAKREIAAAKAFFRPQAFPQSYNDDCRHRLMHRIRKGQFKLGTLGIKTKPLARFGGASA